jgi:small subunit ribosomal protein S11
MAAAMRARVSSVFAASKGSNAPSAAALLASKQPDSVVHVNCTMNNIHVCVSNLDGQVLAKCSGGVLGYKHRERASPVAAREIAENVGKKAIESGYKLSHVHMQGPSRGRSQVLRGLTSAGLKIADIRDVTPMPTNGCRPPHTRRLFSTHTGAAADAPVELI